MIHFIRHRIARFLAGIIGATALLVIAGWILGIDWLTSIEPRGSMQFITAVLFLFSAAELYLMSRAIQDDDEVARLVLPGVSLAILLVIVALFAGQVLGIPTGLESLFLQQHDLIFPPVVLSTTIPTLMSFSLVGLVGIISLFPGLLREKLLFYAGGFIAVVGLVVVAGYLFNIPVLYEVSTCPICAVLFFLLGSGLMQIHKPEANQ